MGRHFSSENVFGEFYSITWFPCLRWKIHSWFVYWLNAVPNLPTGYIWSFRLNFVKILCLKYYSRNLVLFIFRGDNPKSSNEFPWISIWRLVKLHTNYRVDILKARLLLPAFAESYWLIRVTLSKEVVAVHVCNAPHQWHNWWVAGVRNAPPPAKLNVKTGPLPTLYIGIYYSFGFSGLLFFLRFFGCFPVISGYLYSRSILVFLLFLKYFLSVSPWASFS